MRSLTFSILCLAAAFAAAQTTEDVQRAKNMMSSAMRDLQARTGVALALNGVEKVGRTETPFAVRTYFTITTGTSRREAKLEMSTIRGNELKQLIVGDGTRFSVYWPSRSEYAATQYGNEEGAQPEDYVPSLLQLVNGQARGHDAYPARLLKDAYLSGARRTPWQPYLPFASISLAGDTVILEEGNPLRKRMVFSLVPPDPEAGEEDYKLTSVDYWSADTIGGQPRETSWNLSVRGGFVPVEITFRFVQPAGVRGVSLPLKGRVG